MFDLAIIGAGWAGVSAAQEAKRLGLRVALIEKDKLGGTCLNYGCIPTKALIQSAKIYSLSNKSAKFGIQIDNAKINFSTIQKRKEAIISQLSKGMRFLLNDIELLEGKAQFISGEELIIGNDRIKAKNIIIATGAKPIQIPGINFDGKKIISSSNILNLERLPQRLLIIGGGVIGCEFASLFSIFGTRVTIVELMPQLLPQEDKEIAKKLEVAFKKRGIQINTNTDAKTINLDDFELALLCVGRTPELGGLDLQRIGVQTDKNRVITNEYMNTNIANIYAAGDCTGGKLLAHFAAHQGITAAKNIAHPACAKQIQPHLIPNCIFTDPQIASIGITEEEARNKGIKLNLRRFDFLGSGMARILEETEGFIKIISDKETDLILGASIIGPQATELIGIITLAIQSRLKLPQLASIIFAHPTLSESIHEAARE
ncbi:MAG: dihydrolipoyl dehydrogenase [Candidatus Omnitrophota bacterium]|jgi:dihydrolipoamide dehydrogenase